MNTKNTPTLKNLYLDLEGTLIKGFNNSKILHKDIIINFINEYQPDNICVFSYAISNEEDKEVFSTHLENLLHKEFNIIFDNIISIDDMISVISKYDINCPNNFALFPNHYSKKTAFIKFCSSLRNEDTHLLIDDSIGLIEETINTIHTLPIQVLEERYLKKYKKKIT